MGAWVVVLGICVGFVEETRVNKNRTLNELLMVMLMNECDFEGGDVCYEVQ